MSDPFLISFVIRTYNESEFLGKLLDTLRSQTLVPNMSEVVVIDSGSTDNTVEIARSNQVSVIEIEKKDFDYSKAINIGVQKCTGNLIVVISAHAIPTHRDWLERLVTHFKDPKVAGVFCRQLPWPNAYWREEVRINRIFGKSSKLFDHIKDKGSTIPFSNAASCIRRSVWEQHPFCMPAAEDIEWATWAVKTGYIVVYEANASVFHSHDESCRQMAHRAIQLEQAADLRLNRKRSFFLTLKQASGSVVRDCRSIVKLENPKLNRHKLMLDCIIRSFWFIRDFRRLS